MLDLVGRNRRQGGRKCADLLYYQASNLDFGALYGAFVAFWASLR